MVLYVSLCTLLEYSSLKCQVLIQKQKIYTPSKYQSSVLFNSLLAMFSMYFFLLENVVACNFFSQDTDVSILELKLSCHKL